ncbi:OmpA family protein [Parafilimonas sp.]|uniref:OmpA family protein n=1 Tax=Parafilimonas sp. TaxID=1969739 RepID=UPI0039E547D9
MKYLLVCLCCTTIIAKAQHYNPEAVNKQAMDTYTKAMDILQNDIDVKNAIPVLNKAIEYDAKFVDAYLSLAGVYGELKDYNNSMLNYQEAFAIDSAYSKFYLLPYSINLAGTGKFNEALNAVNNFLTIPNLNEKSRKSALYRKSCYEFAVQYAALHPSADYEFAPVNLGDNVNSPRPEYYPSITIDDSILVFTRRGQGIQEDFIESRLTPDGYSKAEVIKGDINAEPSKGAINISQDGEWLLFAGNFAGKGYGNFDLYMSYNTPAGWSEPVNLGANINTEFWESSPSLSPDKNALYFSSDRPGGYGGKDLYVSYRINGKWQPAVNMGADVNTVGDEIAPFIHADNQTLYYTSNGLPGYGGTDIYMLRRISDKQWSKPENLGYPINTIENEGSLFVASDGLTAYYASDRADTKGLLDLYKFKLRPDVSPVKTLYIKGYVTDAKTDKGLPCSVELSIDSSQQVLSNVQTDETGYYFITLPVNKNYTFTVNRKGYLFYSDVFNLADKPSDSVYVKDIALEPVELNATVRLKNIQFGSKSFTLEPVSMIELKKLIQLMNDNPSVRIQINGYTDNIGSDADNLLLSQNRSKAVVDYLISKGIDAKRLTAKGFGETRPVADNSTEEGRSLNRRTEFIVTGL